MSIVDALRAHPTGLRRSPSMKPLVEIETHRTGKSRAFEFQDEYFLKATVGVMFWANDAQYDSVLKQAEKYLLASLHSGVLSKLAEIKMAAAEEDWAGVSRACDALQKELGL